MHPRADHRWGRDRFYDSALVNETAQLIPTSTLRVFPQRGHITVILDRRFAPTVNGFLSPYQPPPARSLRTDPRLLTV
jgi:hypothetical protein